ncbi:MAG: hypothetical protein K2I08_09775 [Muribaculaceae bacterium]|nr:hypothetical protein [Muribaculaceae bacterium]
MKGNKMRHRSLTLLMAIAANLLLAIFSEPLLAQEFSVGGFRDLPNDISAFINPVKDLNDEGCALVKVIAVSTDFAFSTPLGIAKRIDKTGETWLYLPRGSKKITIKHASWGVLRDYLFPSKLESHKTYELVIKEPLQNMMVADTKPIVTTIRDTLVVTKIDTLVVKSEKPTVPLESDILATAGYGGKASYLNWGVLATIMKRHGAFIHVSTDFGTTGHIVATCSKTGLIDGAQRYYSGITRRKSFMATVGAIHRAGSRIAIFEGLGYSSNALAWQLAKSEGGDFVKNSFFSHSGLTAEAGIMIRFNRMAVSASVLTIKGSEWFASIGVGIRINKK